MSDTGSDRSGWPTGVDPISYANINRLGVGQDGWLYWDGKPVETRRRLKFSRFQVVGAVIVGLATAIGGVGTGVNEGFDFGCKVHLWSVECRP